jgi:hypothetical protein
VEETEGSGKWYVEKHYLCIVKVAKDPKRLTQNKHLLTTKKQRKTMLKEKRRVIGKVLKWIGGIITLTVSTFFIQSCLNH